MTLAAILAIVWAHFVSDFILQSDRIAKNKSKNNFILLEHIWLYSIPLCLIGFFIPITLTWVMLNALAHFCTDYITSRMTSKLWADQKVHWFFVTIGFDQAIHFSTLFITYYLLCTHL